MNQTSLVGRPLSKITAAIVGFAERRGVWSGPLMSSSPELARLWSGPPVAADVRVDLETALQQSTFYACARLLATNIGSLQPNHYERLPGGGKQRIDTSSLARLLREPNAEQSRYKFIEQLVFHAACAGNYFAEIVRTYGAQPAQLWPIDPSRVTVIRDAAGQKQYRVSQPAGGEAYLPADNMLHVQGFGWSADVGFNVPEVARQALGLGIAAEQFGGKFFANGAQLGGVVTSDLSEQGRANLDKAIRTEHQGSARAHRWLMAPPNTTFTPIGVNPHDGQMDELRSRQVDEICRYFGISPILIGAMGRATWGNFGEAREQFFVQVITPWLVNIESELMRKLLAPAERESHVIEFNAEGFLRGNAAERGEFYSKMVSIGAYSINNVLALENKPPIPGGDQHYVPANSVAITAPAAPPPEENTPARAAIVATHRDLVLSAMAPLIWKETDRARKNKGSPAKLKAWAESFYRLHEESCVDALRPVMKTHLVFMGSTQDADTYTRALIRPELEAAHAQIKALAGASSEDFQISIERVLTRWEQERPAAIADRILQDEIAYCRTGVAPTLPTEAPPRPSKLASPGMTVSFLEKVHKTAIAASEAPLYPSPLDKKRDEINAAARQR